MTQPEIARRTVARPRPAAVGTLLLALAALPAHAGPLDDLDGYWTGTGTIVLRDSTERVRCAVRYRVDRAGAQIRQVMRCASPDYSINATAELTVRGGQVEGSWEERTYATTGQVTGRYTGASFVLSIQGASFSAAMTVGLSACKQSITIHPKGGGVDVRRISMSLAKC